MNITSEKLKKSEIKLKVELSELEMENYRLKALEKLSAKVEIKGFRPGKVPKDVAEQSLDKNFVLAQTVDLAIAPTYLEAIKQEKIEPIARPKVTVTSQMPLVFEAIIPIYPEVSVKDYKKIKLEKKPVEITEQTISDEIKRFQSQHATYADVDRAAQMGDRVEIDFQGFDEGGAPLDGTTSKNHPLVLGDDAFVPGFEEQLIGQKIAEEREIKVTFPHDYFHKPFQAKVVKFKVKLNRLEQRNLPALDADLIKKVTDKEMSEADFRTELKTKLLQSKEQDEKNRLESSVLEAIQSKSEVDLSDILVEEEIHYMIEEQKHELENRGIKWDQYMEATGKTHEDLHKEKHQEAENRLKLRFGVQELFKAEKIEVSDAEVSAAFDDEMKILATMNYQPKIEEQEMFKTRLLNKLKMEKLITLFIK